MRVAARLGSGSLGAYVISMSQAASDVLAVELLQKEARLMVGGGAHVQGGGKGRGTQGTLPLNRLPLAAVAGAGKV